MMMRNLLITTLTIGLAALGIDLRAEAIWTREFTTPLSYVGLHASGVILAFDSRSAYGLDPATGDIRWQIDGVELYHISSARYPYSPLLARGTPYVILPYRPSMDRSGRYERTFIAVDVRSGKQVWAMDDALAESIVMRKSRSQFGEEPAYLRLEMASMARYYPQRGEVVMIFRSLSIGQGGKKSQNRMRIQAVMGIDLLTGRIKYILSDPAPSQIIESPPVFLHDWAVVDWGGVRIFDTATGEAVAEEAFSRDLAFGAVAYASSPPVVVDDNVIVTNVDRLASYSIPDAEKIWESEPLGAVSFGHTRIPRIYGTGRLLIARLGGEFPLKSGQGVRRVLPIGFAAVEIESGKVVFDSTQTIDRNTQFISSFYIEDNFLYYATEVALRVFNLTTLGVDHEFPVNDVPGVTPIKMSRFEEHIVYQGTHRSILLDPMRMEIAADVIVPSMKKDGGLILQQIAMLALLATSAYFTDSLYFPTYSEPGEQFYADKFSKVDLSRPREADQFGYHLTGSTKDPILKRINFDSGEIDAEVQLQGRWPEFVIDPVNGVVFNRYPGLNGITAYRLSRVED